MDKKTKMKFTILALFVIILFSFALTPKHCKMIHIIR